MHRKSFSRVRRSCYARPNVKDSRIAKSMHATENVVWNVCHATRFVQSPCLVESIDVKRFAMTVRVIHVEKNRKSEFAGAHLPRSQSHAEQPKNRLRPSARSFAPSPRNATTILFHTIVILANAPCAPRFVENYWHVHISAPQNVMTT